MNLGSANSTTPTVDQTDAARFWNGATYLRLALDISADEGLSTFDNARLFALPGTTVADTLITIWNIKYTFDLWRPVTANRQADLDGKLGHDRGDGLGGGGLRRRGRALRVASV